MDLKFGGRLFKNFQQSVQVVLNYSMAAFQDIL